MDKSGLHSQRLDHLGIVAGICNEIGLIEQIDQQIGPNKRNVSVGQAVQALVLNGLGFASRPLYLSPEFFENKPVELLVGEGIEADDLSDDCLGRELDVLFESGVTEVFASVSARALRVFGIETRYAHLDNTSFGLRGEYAVDEQSPPIWRSSARTRQPRCWSLTPRSTLRRRSMMCSRLSRAASNNGSFSI